MKLILSLMAAGLFGNLTPSGAALLKAPLPVESMQVEAVADSSSSDATPIQVPVFRSGFKLDRKSKLEIYQSACSKTFPGSSFISEVRPMPLPFALFLPITQRNEIIQSFEAPALMDPETHELLHPYAPSQAFKKMRDEYIPVRIKYATWIRDLVVVREVMCEMPNPVIQPSLPPSPPLEKQKELAPKTDVCGSEPHQNLVPLATGTDQLWTIRGRRAEPIPFENNHRKHGPNWKTPFPGTQYVNSSGVDYFWKGKDNTLTHCFCAEKHTLAKMTLNYFVDDVMSIELNHQKLVHQVDSVHKNKIELTVSLKEGENCLRVKVEDTGSYFLGIDLSGSITVDQKILVDRN